MTYQWFPGHMTKTIRQIEEQSLCIDGDTADVLKLLNRETGGD